MHYKCRDCDKIWDKGFAVRGYLHCPKCGGLMTLVTAEPPQSEAQPEKKRPPTPPRLESV